MWFKIILNKKVLAIILTLCDQSLFQRPDFDYCHTSYVYDYQCIAKDLPPCLKHEDTYYQVVPLCKTWANAKLYCNMRGMELSKIHSADKNDWLLRQTCFKMRELFWVGPFRDTVHAKFKNPDSSPLPAIPKHIKYWHDGEPRKGPFGHCVINGKDGSKYWRKWNCTARHKFICESKLEACNARKDYGWSQWNIWSGCSKSCGGGITYRSRKCQKGDFKNCHGNNSIDSWTCNTIKCLDLGSEPSSIYEWIFFLIAMIIGAVVIVGVTVAIILINKGLLIKDNNSTSKV